MKKQRGKKIVACLMTAAMIGTLFPLGSGTGGNVAKAASSNKLTDAEINSLYQRVSYQRQSVHDPSIIKKGSDYYVFGSHMGVAKTTDLKNWSSTPISDQNVTNGYYGVRDAQGNVTKVSFNDAFKTGAYGKRTVEIASGKKVEIDFGSMPASDWNTAVDNFKIEGNMWAPDIFFNESMGKYCMYLSLNGSKHNSVVILLTADAIEGPYVYEAPIVYSGFTADEAVSYKKTDLKYVINDGDELTSLPGRYSGLVMGGSYGDYWPHAIDPFVFYDDDNKLWLGYGSWSGGIYMLELDEKTGLRDYTVTYNYEANGTALSDYTAKNKNVTSDPYFGKKIAGGYYVSGEGAYIEKIGIYYYLFISYGFYSPTGGYNMRVFRSEKPDGPYVDVNGTPAIYTAAEKNHINDSRGLQLMGNYQWNTMSVAEVAQGHNSAFVDDDGNAYVIYHTKFADGTAGHQLRVHQLYTNEDGWIVAAPYEYAGEKVNDSTIKSTEIPSEKIVGEYDLIMHQYSNPKAIDEGTVADIDIVKPVDITLNADGTISGKYTGNWEEKAGTAYATITVNGTEYKGVFTEQTIDGSNMKTMCFSAVSSLGKGIWGSKKLSDQTMVAYDAKNGPLMPSAATTDLTLSAKGELGSKISWSSGDTSVISDDGKVTPQASDKNVVLTRTIAKGDYYYEQKIPVTIYGTGGENADTLLYYGSAQSGDTFMPASSINANTGVSLTFTETGITSDWTPIFTTGNGEYVYLSILNYGGINLFEASGTLSSAAGNINPWDVFTDGKTHKVTISYNTSGSIEFYRDDVLMLTYAANTAIGSNTVAGLSKAMATAVKRGILNVQYGMTDISIGYAKDYEEIDISNYLYYQDFETVANASEVWTSKDAQNNLTLANDGEHDTYLSYSFAGDGSTNSRGACSQFNYKDPDGNVVNKVNGNYTVELDVLLKAGSNQETQFAITGEDYAYSGNVINNGLTQGYLLLLSTTNSTTWTINKDDSKEVEIPNVSWVHIKANVSTENKKAVIKISQGDKNLYSGIVAINGTGNLHGLYCLAGRYYSETYVDNVKVYKTPEENPGNITAETKGKLYLDKASNVTVTFKTDGELSENNTISINGTPVKAGDSYSNKITVNKITYAKQEISVDMTARPMEGKHSVEGSFEVALLDSYASEVKTQLLEYDLDSLSENSAYTKIATVADNQYTSAYYKVAGTKMYFMTIVKSDKIHCDGVTAGGISYGWSNGINSELHMTLDGETYSVGSHVYIGEFANPIFWGARDDLIKDSSSVIRGYMSFGTFDDDNDTDKGCVLLNVVDLADIDYDSKGIQGKEFTLSGFIGPNDGGVRFVEVTADTKYTIPGYSAKISGKAYPDAESEVTVTFTSTGTMDSDSIIKIDGTPVTVGETKGLATVKDIVYGKGTADVILTMAPMSGWHNIDGTYEIALCDSSGTDEMSIGIVEYELSMSEGTEYEKIMTEDNQYSTAYYKVSGTKMYFMTIVKSDKIHCDGVTAGGISYGWSNGINSELHMTLDGETYSVGSHVFQAKFANPITWGGRDDLIKDGSSVIRGYMSFGTFDDDNDTDKGCVLLNVVDLKDIGYDSKTVQGKEFTLSGYIGPNDGSGAWATVNDAEKYVFPSYLASVSGKAYLDKGGKVTVTFTSSEPIDNRGIAINGDAVKEGEKAGLATVESITNQGTTVNVVLNMAGISGNDAIPGSYDVALLDSLGNELKSAAVEYALELSADADYKKIATVAENQNVSAYYKVSDTKLYFMTIVKSDKIHCDGVEAGGTTYGWWNGIASELYMTLDGIKYSVGSHVYMGTSANPIGWGTGTANGSFENDLITGSSVSRGFLALGTFDDDTDMDKGCVLLNVVDLADISYSLPDDKPLIVSFSGFIGPNDGGSAFAEVNPDTLYTIWENASSDSTGGNTGGSSGSPGSTGGSSSSPGSTGGSSSSPGSTGGSSGSSGSTGGSSGSSGNTGGSSSSSGSTGGSSNPSGSTEGDNSGSGTDNNPGSTPGDIPDSNVPSAPPQEQPEDNVTTEIRPDGTKVESKTETIEDGTIKETVTETYTDGTVKETVTETRTNGTVSSTVTEQKTDGSKTERKEVTTADNTTLIVDAETKADGTATANCVIRTGNSDQSSTVKIPEELLEDTVGFGNVILEITDTTVNSAVKAKKNTVVNVEVPSVENVTVEKIVLTKESIDTAKETGKGLKVNVVNGITGNAEDKYVVTIPAKQLAKIAAGVKEIDITITAENVNRVANTSKKQKITKVVNKSKGSQPKTCVVEVAKNPHVTAGMKVKIPVEGNVNLGKNKQVYVYKYDEKKGKLVEVAYSKQTLANDGTISISATQGTDYVVSSKKLSGKNVETIKDGISVSASKKTAKTGKKISIKVSLPKTVSKKAKFGTETAKITYKSGNSKVASVSKNGKVKTKKKGTVVITTVIKLSSGQKVTKKQKIKVTAK